MRSQQTYPLKFILKSTRTTAYIDDIASLRDPELFRYSIEAELKARADPERIDPRRNPSYVAKVVADKYVHFVLNI